MMFFIRTAMERDLPSVQTILREGWVITYGPYEGKQKTLAMSDELHNLDRLKVYLARPQSEFIVADDGQCLGGVGYAYLDKNEEVCLAMLYIVPNVKRQGVGSDILAELEGAFPGAKQIKAEIHPKNESAINFYLARGFVETETKAENAPEECGEMSNRTFIKQIEEWSI